MKEVTMNLLRIVPSRELEEMSERFARLVGRIPAGRDNNNEKEMMTVADWVPLVDITEDEKEYLIKVELPEVKREDVKVMVQDGILTIQGERKADYEDKGKKYHRTERMHGTFLRSFTLPDDADETKVLAEVKDGVLKVHVPKSEKAKPRAIEVKVAA
jgi:HSP20 family protein